MAYYDNYYIQVPVAPSAQTVSIKTDDYEILSTESGTLFSMYLAGKDIELTLPESPAAGFWIDVFYPVLTNTISVVTSGSDDFIDSDDGGLHPSAAVVFYGGQSRFFHIGGGKWLEFTYGNWTFSG